MFPNAEDSHCQVSSTALHRTKDPTRGPQSALTPALSIDLLYVRTGTGTWASTSKCYSLTSVSLVSYLGVRERAGRCTLRSSYTAVQWYTCFVEMSREHTDTHTDKHRLNATNRLKSLLKRGKDSENSGLLFRPLRGLKRHVPASASYGSRLDSSELEFGCF